MPVSLADALAIQEVIHRFSNCFDLKDWAGLETCFTETLHADYSDLRGTPPESLDSKHYVALRRQALQDLKTHHLCGNHEIEGSRRQATCRTSMTIDRLDPGTQERFTTHCYYVFGLQKTDAGWKISRITQKVLWNEGNSSIHSGVQ
jgi:hypothetical protein